MTSLRTLIAKSHIVEVYEEGVRCLICGVELECAGTHFSRAHDLPLRRGMSRSERLRIYGLPLGARLSSRRLRDESRERSDVEFFGSKRNVFQKGVMQAGREAQTGLGSSFAMLEAKRAAALRSGSARKLRPAVCGSMTSYRRGCRCDACRSANAKVTRLRTAAITGKDPVPRGPNRNYKRAEGG